MTRRYSMRIPTSRTVLGFAPKYSDIDTIVRTAAPFFGLEAVA